MSGISMFSSTYFPYCPKKIHKYCLMIHCILLRAAQVAQKRMTALIRAIKIYKTAILCTYKKNPSLRMEKNKTFD